MTDRSPDARALSPAEILFVPWLRDPAAAPDFEPLVRDHPEHVSELRALHAACAQALGSEPQSFARKLQEQYGSGVDPHVALAGEESSSPASTQLLQRLAEHS